MKDYTLPMGLVKKVELSKPENKGFFSLRKMFRDYLKKLNVIFFDSCCPEASVDSQPTRFNADTDELERFNGTEWIQVNPTFLTGGGFTGEIEATEGTYEFTDGLLSSFTPTP